MSTPGSILDRDTVGAFCRHTHVALPGASSGPLAGLTFGLKDLFDVAGHRTGFGSPDWLATHPPAPAHAAVLSALLAPWAEALAKAGEQAMVLRIKDAVWGTLVTQVGLSHSVMCDDDRGV